jgi:glucose-6-phosphate-specific signal transduction histidine kinase
LDFEDIAWTMTLLTPETIAAIAKRLSALPSVSRYDLSEERQAETIAHAAADIERSCRELTDKILPRLLDQSLDQQALEDVLFDLGDELRHIIYHVQDTKYFAYLSEDRQENSRCP